MSESKANLRKGRDIYKGLFHDSIQRRDSAEETCATLRAAMHDAVAAIDSPGECADARAILVNALIENSGQGLLRELALELVKS